MRRIGVSALLAATLLAALVGCGGDAPAAPRTAALLPAGERALAPELAGELLDGTPFDSAQVRGDVVVVNFWGSWCGPCVAEADDLEAAYQATKDTGVSFIGVNVRDTRDAASAFAAQHSTYPSIFDPAGKLVLGFEVPPLAIPSTVIIDREGRVAVMINRGLVRTELEPLVAEVAAEQASS